MKPTHVVRIALLILYGTLLILIWHFYQHWIHEVAPSKYDKPPTGDAVKVNVNDEG